MDDLKDFCGTGLPLDPEPTAPVDQPEVTEPASDGGEPGPGHCPFGEDVADDGPWGGEPWYPGGTDGGRGWPQGPVAAEVDDFDWDDAA